MNRRKVYRLTLAFLAAWYVCCSVNAQERPSNEVAFWRSEMLRNYDRVQAVADNSLTYTQDELLKYRVDASLCWHDSVRAYILVNKKVQGTIDFAFRACKDLLAPVVQAWNLQGKERGDAFNRWVWPLTGSAISGLGLWNDMPDTWDDLQRGFRPSEKYKLSPQDQRKSEEIVKAKVKLVNCVKKLPRPREGTWLTVSSELRSYAMACGEDLVTLMGTGAGSTKELGVAFAVTVASDAANCKYANSAQQNTPESERLVVCRP